MPKKQRKTKRVNVSYLKIAVFMLPYLLIKIGNVPIWLIQQTINTAQNLQSIKFKPQKKKAVAKPKKIITKSIRKNKNKKYLFPKLPKLPKFKFPSLSFPNVSFSIPKPKLPLHLKRGKGRPRNTWFVPYYLNKLKIFYRKRLPLKVKVSFVLVTIVFLLYTYTSFIFSAAYQLPSPEKLVSSDKALTTEFLDRNGKLLYRMYEGRNRTLVNLNELPSYVIQATIAIEDKKFYSHIGVDPVAIFRALIANIRNQADTKSLEGASTLTQQLIKNTLLTPEKTYSRKVKEIILALWAERVYNKDQILQMYLNEAPYGGPAWGIEAASQTYFGRPANELTLAQASYLAGLPASPTQFSPYGTNPELAKNRQKEVLRRMVEDKYITQSQSDIAYQQDINLKPQINNIQAGHFVMYIRDLLSQKYGQRVVSQGGLKITTTLDLDLQKQVEEVVSEEAEKLISLNVKNAASMVTDPKTGQILAMVGSKDYHEPNFGSFNVALSLRQPGSSIKVITYATAFKEGYTPGNTILDTPVVFKDNWGNSYSPVNYDGKYHGPVSLRTALGSSYNIPAVKLISTVGVEEMMQTSKDMGITTFTDPKRYGLSLTLGGGEVRMIDMMDVYGTLSQQGEKRESTPILKVINSDGQVLEEYEDHPTKALTSQVAYLVTDILSDNKARTPSFGANSLLNIPGSKVAVKTGTTDNKRDNWTFGYTDDFVVGVWVGNNDNTPMHPSLTSGVTGAAPIWNRITQLLLEKKPSLALKRPEGIIEATIDGRRDLAISQSVPKSLVRIFKKDDKVVFSDPYSTYATPSAVVSSTETTTN